MPSSLTRDHSSALASSAYLPVSVCGTDTYFLPRGHFLSAQAPHTPGRIAPPVVIVPRSTTSSFTPKSPYTLERSSSERCIYHSASPIGQTVVHSTGISTCSPSAHTLVFPLGPTNPPRITLAAEPLDFRRGRFSLPFSVTRSGIRTRNGSTAGFRCNFTAITTLPYHRFLYSVLRYNALAPLDCRRIVTRPVSCYALF